jgi:hypothetical protein
MIEKEIQLTNDPNTINKLKELLHNVKEVFIQIIIIIKGKDSVEGLKGSGGQMGRYRHGRRRRRRIKETPIKLFGSVIQSE